MIVENEYVDPLIVETPIDLDLFYPSNNNFTAPLRVGGSGARAGGRACEGGRDGEGGRGEDRWRKQER